MSARRQVRSRLGRLTEGVVIGLAVYGLIQAIGRLSGVDPLPLAPAAGPAALALAIAALVLVVGGRRRQASQALRLRILERVSLGLWAELERYDGSRYGPLPDPGALERREALRQLIRRIREDIRARDDEAA